MAARRGLRAERCGSPASRRPGSRGVVFLPWVFGAMSPAPDARHRGAFSASPSSTRCAPISPRAMLEGVAMQMRWLADEVETAHRPAVRQDALRRAVPQLSDVWATIMADVVGRPIEQLEDARHTNARGAGLMAFVSTGAADHRRPRRARAGPRPIRARPVRPPCIVGREVGRVRELHAALADPVSRLHS